MYLQFSTNNKRMAKERLRKALPTISGEFLEYLLKKVEEGKIRVGEPFMYENQAPIFPTELISEEEITEIQKKYLMETIKEKP